MPAGVANDLFPVDLAVLDVRLDLANRFGKAATLENLLALGCLA